MSLLLCRFLGIPLAPGAVDHSPAHSFSSYLLSVAGELRAQMHTSRLYVGVFAALGLAGLLWVIAEKSQHKSKWDRRDVLWMVGFAALLACSAILYRLGTHSAMAARFAMAGTIADAFGIGVALSVPMILWFHWHKPKAKALHQDDANAISSFHYSRTILGLQDASPPPATTPVAAPVEIVAPEAAAVTAPAEMVATETSAMAEPAEIVAHEAAPVMAPAAEMAAHEAPAVTEPAKAATEEIPAVGAPAAIHFDEPLEKTLPEQNEPVEAHAGSEATVMENADIMGMNSQPPASTQPQPEATQPPPSQPYAMPHAPAEPLMSQPYTPQPAAAPQPAAYHPMTAPPPPLERGSAPGTPFRDQLYALNASWQRIESTGKEVEDWFQRQQRLVLAHLERPARGHDTHVDLSRDFLEQRMDKVDAEWAAIQRTVRELYHWLENSGPERPAPQETKVW